MLVGPPIERGVASFAAAKEATVTAGTATTTSIVQLTVIGTTAKVKERKAGSFIIELSESATTEVAWTVLAP